MIDTVLKVLSKHKFFKDREYWCKHVLIIGSFFLYSINLFSQDATFSQYYASGLYLNPAFAGMESRITFNSNYRNQWKSLGSPYVTSQASLIMPIRLNKTTQKHVGGAGLSFYNNTAGDGNLKTTGVNLSLGYNVHLSHLHYLSFGLQGGFVQKNVNLDNFNWGSQYNSLVGGFDESININTSNILGKRSFADFAGGLMYYFNPERDYQEDGNSFYLGASAYHLSHPNESMVRDLDNSLPLLLKFHAGYERNLSYKLNVSPNVLIASQNGRQQINGGVYLTYIFGNNAANVTPALLILGGWYRVKDSFIFSAGLGNNNYTLGFSYDMNNSSLRYNTRGTGAYEVSLKIQIGSQKSVKIYNPLI